MKHSKKLFKNFQNLSSLKSLSKNEKRNIKGGSDDSVTEIIGEQEHDPSIVIDDIDIM